VKPDDGAEVMASVAVMPKGVEQELIEVTKTYMQG
jgi:hypothetical protein